MAGKAEARKRFRERVTTLNKRKKEERRQASYTGTKQKRSDYKGEGLKNPSIIHRIKTAIKTKTTTGKKIENRKKRETVRRTRKSGKKR
jgi:hypothetical protein